jgi:flagellar biogenesis protein FliO
LLTLAAGGAVAQDTKADDWIPEPSQAQAGTDAETAEAIGEDVEPVSVLGILGKLALVAGLIYAAAWGFKMYQERDIGESRAGAGGLIHIRESVSLGASGRLYVVKFADRNLLMASIGDRVSVLADDSAKPTETPPVDPLAALADGNGDGKKTKKHRGNGGVHPGESPAAWAKKRDMLIQSLQEADV